MKFGKDLIIRLKLLFYIFISLQPQYLKFQINLLDQIVIEISDNKDTEI